MDWASITGDVAKLMASDGTFSDSPGGEQSVFNAGMAYSILAASWKAVKGDSSATSHIRSVTSTIGVLLQGADGSEYSELSLGSGEDRLAATSLVLSSALKLASVSGEDVDVQVEQVAGFANFLLQHRHSANLRSIGQVVIGLRAVASNKVAVPLTVQLPVTSFSLGSTDDVVVTVTDVFGAFASEVEVCCF